MEIHSLLMLLQQMSVEQGRVLDYTSDPIYTPLDIVADAQPLKGCVPSIR
jgi:hypothetical protein